MNFDPKQFKMSKYVHMDERPEVHQQFSKLQDKGQSYQERVNIIQQNDRIVEQVRSHFKNPVSYEGDDKQGDLVMQNEYYKHYNDRLQKQFEDLLTGKGFSIYQKDLIIKPTSGNAFEELLISSDRISPLLKALEDENKILKEEVGHLSGDLKRFIGMVELLLEENKYIREHINQKNRDIGKLIETIGLNDGEEINDLKHKIHILTEENNILIKHLDEMKRFREEYDNFVYENENEVSRAREVIEKLKYDHDETRKKEEVLAKQLAQIEPKYSQLMQKNAEFEDLNEELTNKLNHIKNENQTLKSEYLHYKSHFEDLSRKRGDENDQLLQENNMLMNEKKELKQQLLFKDRQIEEFKQQAASFRKDVETKGYDLDELSQAVNEFKNQIQIEKQRAEGALQRERKMREEFEVNQNETEKNKMKCAQIEKQYNSLLESSRQDVQDKHIKYEGLIEKLKIKNREDLESRDEEITELRTKNVEKDRIMQQLNNELERRNADVNDFKKKLSELKESRSLLDKQSSELIQLKNENRDLHNALLENKNSKSTFLGGDKEYKQMLDQIRELELNVSKFEKRNTYLGQENDQLKKQIEDQKQEVRDYQEKYTLAKKEAQQLMDDKDDLIFGYKDDQNKQRGKIGVSYDIKGRADKNNYERDQAFNNDVYLQHNQ